ncbi:MAG: ATP-binding protein [Acidobacteria bacterium]|nr:ATP-binding protein [Acidobacteriota bacterium]
MRLVTKIVTLTAALIAPLVLVLAVQFWWVQRLARVTESLPVTTFRVGAANLELSRLLVELHEFSRKVDVSGADYLAGWESLHADTRARLRALAALELSLAERDAVTRLQTGWQEYSRLPPLLPASSAVLDGELQTAQASHLGVHLAALDRLGAQLREFSAATEKHLESRKREARRTASLSKRVGWLVVATVCLLALPILWWTIRSIHRPLRRLTAGTRDVAAGRFALQLDESSGDELAEVAASFNRMVRRLRELDELKRDFLSHVSHELNTPLVAMRETNELVLDGLAGPLTQEQKHMLELNREAAARLSGMIRRVLDLSRLEAGAMQYDFEALELGQLLQRVVDEFTAAAREREVTLDLALPGSDVVARCDRDRLHQVMGNLLANAIKFAPAGSCVRVALEARGRTGAPVTWQRGRDSGQAVMTVRDEGPGVPAEHREQIFEKFHRGSRRGSHGFGLGLTISREIVAAHGGRIWVRDNRPQGCVFGVELAALSQQTTGAAGPDSAPASGAPEARAAGRGRS